MKLSEYDLGLFIRDYFKLYKNGERIKLSDQPGYKREIVLKISEWFGESDPEILVVTQKSFNYIKMTHDYTYSKRYCLELGKFEYHRKYQDTETNKDIVFSIIFHCYKHDWDNVLFLKKVTSIYPDICQYHIDDWCEPEYFKPRARDCRRCPEYNKELEK